MLEVTAVAHLADGYLARGVPDCLRHLGVDDAEVGVDGGRGRLDPGQCDDHLARHWLARHLVGPGPLGLRGPECIGGNLDLAHRVVLDAERWRVRR